MDVDIKKNMAPNMYSRFSIFIIAIVSAGCDGHRAVRNSSPANSAGGVKLQDEVKVLRDSLQAYLAQCNSRIAVLEAKHGGKRPIRLIPSAIDIRKTDSALSPYSGILNVRVLREDGTGYWFDFTLRPAGESWEYVSCHGGPTRGKDSDWSLTDLAHQFQGRIAMAWLLGDERAKQILGL